MSKKQNSNAGSTSVKKSKFKVAYSINNWQPVQCTHISDQPFFYMDDECAFEEFILENEFASEFEDEMHSEDLNKIKQKIQSLENTICGENSQKVQRHSEFMVDADFISDKFVSTTNTIDTLTDILKQTSYGTGLLSNKTKISFGDITQKSYLDSENNLIVINENIDETEQLLLAILELRRADQCRNNANINPLTVSPDQALLVNRAQKADLTHSVIRCAWELKLQNNDILWKRIKTSTLSDLARAFEREVTKDFRSLNNGKAASVVFESWFLSERAVYEDKILIQNMLADHKNYTYSEESKTENFAIDLIKAIGTQPIGKNYLEAYAHFIVNDGLFTETRDRSTANFLWFIKFEHRFQEAEHDLQSSEAIKINDTKAYQNKKIFEDTENASTDSTTDNVVCLFQQTGDRLQF